MPRPRRFDETKSLEAAMHAFWREGYSGVNAEQLVRLTGASRNGLYAAFGSKQGLYLAGLDRYRDVLVPTVYAPLFESHIGLGELAGLLRRRAGRAGLADGRSGCFLCKASVDATHLDGVAIRVHLHMERVSRRVAEVLAPGREAGQVARRQPVLVQARFVTSTLYAVFLLVRGGAGQHAIDMAEATISALAA